MWYHYYAIGGTVATVTFLVFLFIKGNIKENIILKKKEYYFFPIFRGIFFIAVLIIAFYSLKHIPIKMAIEGDIFLWAYLVLQVL